MPRVTIRGYNDMDAIDGEGVPGGYPSRPARRVLARSLQGERVQSHVRLHPRSRNDDDFSQRYPRVLKRLGKRPDETPIDGEVIALDDDSGRSTCCGTTARRPRRLVFRPAAMIFAGKDHAANRYSGVGGFSSAAFSRIGRAGTLCAAARREPPGVDRVGWTVRRNRADDVREFHSVARS